METGDSVGLGGVGRYDSEEFGLGVEDEVGFENDSSVDKGVEDEFNVGFVGSVGVMGLVDMLIL